jgi:YD repeat-containing protein
VRNFLLRSLVAGLLTVAASLPGLASLLPFRDALSPTPANDSEIKTAVDIVGTASDAHLAQWTLSFAPANTGNFTQIATGSTSVVNGVLGRFDPTVLANGIYDVLLTVFDANGTQSFDQSTYEVTGYQKIGQFSVSFLDLSVDASGIPIRVTRTYDTRRKIESLDFGYGGTVDYQNVRVQKNVTTGLGWVVTADAFTICVRATSKRKVNVTLPDGRVERFEAGLTTECAFGQVPPVSVVFNPIGLTTSSLEAYNVPDLVAQGGNIVEGDSGLPWNPKQFKLTTVERYVYLLDENFGITKVTEPNGNFLTYSSAGIIHSSGLSVAFTRDSQGRIATVTDPAGKQIVYTYDTAGNLATITDRSLAQ